MISIRLGEFGCGGHVCYDASDWLLLCKERAVYLSTAEMGVTAAATSLKHGRRLGWRLHVRLWKEKDRKGNGAGL